MQKPFLRNLFFQILRLYSEGVSLVMVVDGEATQLKWSTMDQREKASHGRGGASYHRNRQTGRCTQLNLNVHNAIGRVFDCVNLIIMSFLELAIKIIAKSLLSVYAVWGQPSQLLELQFDLTSLKHRNDH